MKPSRIPTHDKWILAVIAAQSLAVGCYVLIKLRNPGGLKETSLSRTDIVGRDPRIRGDARAAYTLVEFGDFQCPPCAMAEETLDGLLKKFPTKLSVVFCNNPLNMHTLANPCALIAEAASTNKEYWRRHRALFGLQPRLSEGAIAELKKSYGNRGESNAIVRLDHDVKLAKNLKLDSTPGFFLVEPSGKVFRAVSLDAVARAIQ